MHRHSSLFACMLLSTAVHAAPPGKPTATKKAVPPPVAMMTVPAELSSETKDCIDCHRTEHPGLFQEWGRSAHFRANVGCFECHKADKGDPDVLDHRGFLISVVVSPKDCGRCHSTEAKQFADSHHSKGARILGSQDNVLAEVVEGNSGFKTPGFPQGNSAAAVSGCWQCHGAQVKVLEGGRMDPATWPNTGIGRINPDGSEGSCSACHQRHAFSVAQARHPDTCGRCHLGPDHPQKEIYEESKHGIAFFASQERMNLDSAKWVAGEDYSVAATCATCHMSAAKTQPVTHDVGLRLSWNNRPPVSVRPDVADAKMGLPGKDVPWKTRRDNMTEVCSACHADEWVSGFYAQYDAVVELYNSKFATPGQELYQAARKLLPPVEFAHRIDFIWFELWHHEGRRARHGASMMAPDFTHWHGTYEVAKHFYTEFIPELEKLAAEGMTSKDPAHVAAGKELKAKIDQVLQSPDHRWYRGGMDPAEKERRQKAADEFRKRYSK